jgi:hypothetical protein
MGMFTLEVSGRPVACIRAETADEAEQSLDDPWFRDGLLGLSEEERPVWRGDADVRVREASPEELGLIAPRLGGNDEATFILLPGGNAPQPDSHPRILASRVEHTPAFNRAGEHIGHIADLSIDRRSGQVVYALMSFGGFLGIGKRFHPVPWQTLRYEPALAGYIVPLTKDDLKGAPHYDADELRELGGAREDPFGAHVLEYYGRYGPPMI